MNLNAKELFEMLNSSDETTQIEAKAGSGIGKSILETISAFSNEPGLGGGYLFLGAKRRDVDLFGVGYEIAPIEDPDKIQSDFASKCNDSFSSPIRPQIFVDEIGGKTVVVAFVPEADPLQKPVFIKSRGALNGSYRRLGPSDVKCTEDDLALMFQARGVRSFDQTPISGSSLRDIDPQAIKAYREFRDTESHSQLETLSNAELLYSLHATESNLPDTELTLAGLVLFGRPSSIRRFLPMTRVDYIRIDGNEWMHDPENRYTAVERIGPLILTIAKLIDIILDEIPKAFDLSDSDIHRRDKPVVPKKVIRESVVNALMHRSYQVHQPVQIVRYANRIEISNPGYSLVSSERIAEAGSRTRNPKIAAVLHEFGLAETKGTGIKVMQRAMQKSNLTSPIIDSSRSKNEFKISLLVHHFMGEAAIEWLSRFADCNLSPDEANALVLLKELGTINNAAYRQINDMDTLTASGHLKRLRGLGIIDKRGKGPSTHYTPGVRFFQNPEKTTKKRPPQPLTEPLTQAQREQQKALREELTMELKEALGGLGKRITRGHKDLIVRLCSIRPYSANELALLLEKSPRGLRDRTLSKMVKDCEIDLYFKENISHPQQKYVSAVILD